MRAEVLGKGAENYGENETIRAGGDDDVYAGNGDDTVYGEAGNDKLGCRCR